MLFIFYFKYNMAFQDLQNNCSMFNIQLQLFFFWNTSAINAGKPRLIWFCQDLYKVLTCITLGVKVQVKASGAQYFKDVCSCDNTA